ncbi:SagB/ThcOx family dehydrogenase, partial [uncultured Clostridium sp.]
YKAKVLSRNLVKQRASNKVIQLKNSSKNNDDYFYTRRSCRKFNTKKLIDFNKFSNLLSKFSQINKESIQYIYPSAGGLYAIDIYINVKKDRVSGVEEGNYYYSPIDNTISKINIRELSREIHFYTNKNIYDESAFSIFLVYNSECNMPKYKGMGYIFGLLDSGIITGYLDIISEQINLGVCSIGDMNFEELNNVLDLNSCQTCFHCLEFGLKSEE